jgi:hypothetical protein
MTARDQLPIPDYDHLAVGTLAHQIRSLDASGLQALLDYEKAHGNRLPVVQVLERRFGELQDGDEPSGGDPTTSGSQGRSASQHGSNVTRGGPAARSPQAAGDRHAFTNPAQKDR